MCGYWRILSSVCTYTCRLEYSGNYCELLMVISDVISCTMSMSTPFCSRVCCASSQHSSWQCWSRAGQVCVLCPAGSRRNKVSCSPVGEESQCCWLPTHPAGSGRPPGRQLLDLQTDSQAGSTSERNWAHLQEKPIKNTLKSTHSHQMF